MCFTISEHRLTIFIIATNCNFAKLKRPALKASLVANRIHSFGASGYGNEFNSLSLSIALAPEGTVNSEFSLPNLFIIGSKVHSIATISDVMFHNKRIKRS